MLIERLGRGLLGVMLALILTTPLVGCSSSSGEAAKDASDMAAAKKRKVSPYFNLQSPYSNVDQKNTRHARSSLEAANVADLEQAWSRQIEGEGESLIGFPVVSDDVVYLQDLDSNVAAIDLDDGETLWEKRYEVPSPRPDGVSLSRGFFMAYGATTTKVFALDEKTGKEVWSAQLARPGSGAEVTAPPAYYNGRVYVPTGPEGEGKGETGALWAFDCRDGTRGWHIDIRGKVSEPPAFDLKGSIYAGTGSSIVKLDEAFGKVDWRYQIASRGTRERDVGSPIVKDLHGREMVIAGSRSGTVVALDRKTGKPLWRREVGTDDRGVSGPLSIRRSMVFVPVADGELVALDLATGEVRWKYRFPSPLAAPTLTTNDLVLAASRTGTIAAFQAGDGMKVWSEELPGPVEGMTLGGKTLLVQSGAPGPDDPLELSAYRLGG